MGEVQSGTKKDAAKKTARGHFPVESVPVGTPAMGGAIENAVNMALITATREYECLDENTQAAVSKLRIIAEPLIVTGSILGGVSVAAAKRDELKESGYACADMYTLLRERKLKASDLSLEKGELKDKLIRLGITDEAAIKRYVKNASMMRDIYAVRKNIWNKKLFYDRTGNNRYKAYNDHLWSEDFFDLTSKKTKTIVRRALMSSRNETIRKLNKKDLSDRRVLKALISDPAKYKLSSADLSALKLLYKNAEYERAKKRARILPHLKNSARRVMVRGTFKSDKNVASAMTLAGGLSRAAVNVCLAKNMADSAASDIHEVMTKKDILYAGTMERNAKIAAQKTIHNVKKAVSVSKQETEKKKAKKRNDAPRVKKDSQVKYQKKTKTKSAKEIKEDRKKQRARGQKKQRANRCRIDGMRRKAFEFTTPVRKINAGVSKVAEAFYGTRKVALIALGVFAALVLSMIMMVNGALNLLISETSILLVDEEYLDDSGYEAEDFMPDDEIERILESCDDTDELRNEVASFALSMVGQIPYYWGGKPESGDYEENDFFSYVPPDVKGRSAKGLDCSGFVKFVYWHVLGSPISASNTGDFTGGKYKKVSASDLRPGDVGLLRDGYSKGSGNANHIGIFVGRDDGGNALYVHCTGQPRNIVVCGMQNFKVFYRIIPDEGDL